MTKYEILRVMLKHRYAHRGLHNKPTIPENSMAAFKLAVENGFGIELDVHLTKDGKLAVIHDNSLKRTCGVDINVEDLTLAEAQMYFLEESQERIPELSEVLELVAGKVPLIVELKVGTNKYGYDVTEVLCYTAAGELDRYNETYGSTGLGEECLYCVESFSPNAMKWFKLHRPDIVRGQLGGNINHDKKTITPFQNFLVRNLFINRISEPDFVAYNYRDRKDPGLRRYTGPLFYYTIKKYEDLKGLERQGAAGIFEQFNPKDFE